MNFISVFFIIFFSFILIYNAKYVENFNNSEQQGGQQGGGPPPPPPYPSEQVNSISKKQKEKIDKLMKKMKKISKDQDRIDSYYNGPCDDSNKNNCGDIPELFKKFNNIKKKF